MTIENQNTNQTQTNEDPFLTTKEMAEYYPLLTVMFDVASDVLMNTPMEADTKQQFKLELDTFYRSLMRAKTGFSQDYDSLSDEEQEAECKTVGSFIYFASLMRMFVKKVASAPVVEELNTTVKDDGTSKHIH